MEVARSQSTTAIISSFLVVNSINSDGLTREVLIPTLTYSSPSRARYQNLCSCFHVLSTRLLRTVDDKYCFLSSSCHRLQQASASPRTHSMAFTGRLGKPCCNQRTFSEKGLSYLQRVREVAFPTPPICPLVSRPVLFSVRERFASSFIIIICSKARSAGIRKCLKLCEARTRRVQR